MQRLFYPIAEYRSAVPGYEDKPVRSSLTTYTDAAEARMRLRAEAEATRTNPYEPRDCVIAELPHMLTIRVRVPVSCDDRGRWIKTAWQTICYRIEPLMCSEAA